RHGRARHRALHVLHLIGERAADRIGVRDLALALRPDRRATAHALRRGALRREHAARGREMDVPDLRHHAGRAHPVRILQPGGCMRPRTVFGAIAVAVAVAAPACSKGGAGTGESPTPSGVASPRPSSTAQLSLVSPTNGEVIHGTSVTVKVMLT